MKTIVVLSTYVESVIREEQQDTKFLLFSSIHDLAKYLEDTPIRAEALYITQEVLRPAVNTSMDYLIRLLGNFFFTTDSVFFILEKDSRDILAVKDAKESLGLKTWKIVTGPMSKEFIVGVITGSLREDNVILTRKAVYRQNKKDYLKTQRNQVSDTLEEHYLIEEEMLDDIPYEDIKNLSFQDINKSCKIYNIAGLKCNERTIFSLTLAQYLSFKGKTILVEKDFEYFTLTNMLNKSGIKYMKIDVNELYSKCEATINQIKISHENLIVITASKRSDRDYYYIINLLYSNLMNNVTYMVVENNLNEIASTAKYITVMANNIISILKTCENIPDNYKSSSKYVCINITQIKEISVLNSEVSEVVVKDLLQISGDINVPVLNIGTLKLGGEAHDLRMFVEEG